MSCVLPIGSCMDRPGHTHVAADRSYVTAYFSQKRKNGRSSTNSGVILGIELEGVRDGFLLLN
jgi:hypothetical protein